MWIYVPKASKNSAASPYARATQESILAYTLQSDDIVLCVSSSGKLMQRPLSWRGWQTRPWIKLLFGTICDPSTAELGVAEFISSLPAILANPSARQESDRVSKTRDTCGRRSRGSPEKSNQSGCSARTSRATSLWDLPKSAQSFAKWATLQRRESSRRERQAVAIGVAASSCWPTPTATDGGYFPDISFETEAMRFVAPRGVVTKGSSGQFPISNAARVWTALRLTILAIGLNLAAAKSLSMPQVQLNLRSGKGSFLSGLISNPRFYDHLMGWPIGWTRPGQPVMEYQRWLQQSRGELSRLLTSTIWQAPSGRSFRTAA